MKSLKSKMKGGLTIVCVMMLGVCTYSTPVEAQSVVARIKVPSTTFATPTPNPTPPPCHEDDELAQLIANLFFDLRLFLSTLDDSSNSAATALQEVNTTEQAVEEAVDNSCTGIQFLTMTGGGEDYQEVEGQALEGEIRGKREPTPSMPEEILLTMADEVQNLVFAARVYLSNAQEAYQAVAGSNGNLGTAEPEEPISTPMRDTTSTETTN